MSVYYLEPKENGSEKIVRRNLPTGFAWLAFHTPAKNFYKIVSGLCKSLDTAWAEFYRVVSDELNPYRTKNLMPEWEKALGLPDKCIGPMTDLEDRRDMVLLRLMRKRYTTAPTWVELARDVFGLEIKLTPGWYVQKPCLYPFEYPRRYDLYPKLGRFRIYIDVLNVDFNGYPYDGTKEGNKYPIPYGSGDEGFKRFKCFIERIRPSNVAVIWNDNPLDLNETYSQSGAYIPADIPFEV